MTYVPVPLNAISGVFYTLAVLIGLLVLAALRQGHNARRDRERLDAFTAYMQWLEADYERRTGVKPRPPVHVRRGSWRHRRQSDPTRYVRHGGQQRAPGAIDPPRPTVPPASPPSSGLDDTRLDSRPDFAAFDADMAARTAEIERLS